MTRETKMELLCLLPKSPVRAYLSDIVRDLNLIRQDQVLAMAEALRSKGFVIEVHNSREGREMCIGANSWEYAQVMGNAYWRTR